MVIWALVLVHLEKIYWRLRTQATFFFFFFSSPQAITQVKEKKKQGKKKIDSVFKINDLRLIGTSLIQFANGLGWRNNILLTEFTYSTGAEYMHVSVE